MTLRSLSCEAPGCIFITTSLIKNENEREGKSMWQLLTLKQSKMRRQYNDNGPTIEYFSLGMSISLVEPSPK